VEVAEGWATAVLRLVGCQGNDERRSRDGRHGQDDNGEAGGKVLADEHGDRLRAAVAFLADVLMEGEVEQARGPA
jgi:hypothetical protein